MWKHHSLTLQPSKQNVSTCKYFNAGSKQKCYLFYAYIRSMESNLEIFLDIHCCIQWSPTAVEKVLNKPKSLNQLIWSLSYKKPTTKTGIGQHVKPVPLLLTSAEIEFTRSGSYAWTISNLVKRATLSNSSMPNKEDTNLHLGKNVFY